MAWRKVTDLLGAPRYGAIGFSYGTKGYVGLGRYLKAPTIYHNDLWEYNTTTGAWSQKASLPGTGRCGSAVFTLGAKAYVCMGVRSSIEFVDTYEYDTTTNAWSIKTPFPAQGKRYATAFGIGTRGYVGLGVGLGGLLSSSFYAFIPSENNGMGKWYTMPSFSSVGRHSAVGFTIGTKGYVGLGTSGGIFRADFYEYNPSTNQWTAKDSYGGGARTAATCFVTTSNKAYVGLGYYSIPVSGGMNSDFWEFDPALSSGSQWKQVFNFIGLRRHNAVGFGVGANGYLGTGTTGDIELKDFFILEPTINETVESTLVVRWDITSSIMTATGNFAWDIKDLTDTSPYALSVGWNIEGYTHTTPFSIDIGWDLFNWFQNPNTTIALGWNIDGYSSIGNGLTTSWNISNYANISSSLGVGWNIEKYAYTTPFSIDIVWDMFEYDNVQKGVDCVWNILVFYNTPDFALACEWSIDSYLSTAGIVLECGWDVSAYQDADVSLECSWDVQNTFDTDLVELGCSWDIDGFPEVTLECGWDIFEGEGNAYYSTSKELGWDITANTISSYINSGWSIANYTEDSIETGWDIITLGKPIYEFESEERHRVFKKEIIRKKQ